MLFGLENVPLCPNCARRDVDFGSSVVLAPESQFPPAAGAAAALVFGARGLCGGRTSLSNGAAPVQRLVLSEGVAAGPQNRSLVTETPAGGREAAAQERHETLLPPGSGRGQLSRPLHLAHRPQRPVAALEELHDRFDIGGAPASGWVPGGGRRMRLGGPGPLGGRRLRPPLQVAGEVLRAVRHDGRRPVEGERVSRPAKRLVFFCR